MSNHYEVTNGVVTKYYFAGTQRIAMRKDNILTYMLSDHLGSTSLITNATGGVISETRYTAWGEVRYQAGTMSTGYGFTGQYSYASDFGLLYFNARWVDPVLGRFAQADTIVPAGVQGYDRYAFVNNNPIRYTDPSGHFCYDDKAKEFSSGDCYDALQQELLDDFLDQLESGDYTDLELTENLIIHALELSSDPVVALRAVSEIVREETPDGFGWSYEAGSKFFYGEHTKETFDDSGFGDLMDTVKPNQIAHTIGIAYIAAYQEETNAGWSTDILVWGHEVKGNSAKQKDIDRDLGYIASNLGAALAVDQNEAVSDAMSQIEAYDYAEEHPIRNWWYSWP